MKSRPGFIAWHRPTPSSRWRPIWSSTDEAQVLATAQAMQRACGRSGGQWEVRPIGNPPWQEREPMQRSLFV
jgi:hypothetical protein